MFFYYLRLPGKESLKEPIRKWDTWLPTKRVHQRRTDHVPMGEMPLAAYPMQIVGADLKRPFFPSHNGNRYVLTLIAHCTGWAEAFPLEDRTNASVWQAWATHVVPRHGAPEVLITDNGQKFKATAWRTYLKQMGVERRTTTPVHPRSNGFASQICE